MAQKRKWIKISITMKRYYKIDLFDPNTYDYLIDDLEKLSDALGSKDFMNFIADKCILELNRISNEKLDGIREDDVTYSEINKYRSNHKVDVGDDFVIISNDTMADLSHLTDKTKANYPEGLSIAKVIEFGTGVWGESNTEFDWTVQQNPDRNYDKGWYYERDGSLHWSKGMGGKFIYNELLETVRKNFGKWVNEYIDKI